MLARKATTMNTDDFAAAQQALGMTHHAGSILLDRTLDQIVDPVKHYLHDIMHCLFVDGVCNVSVYLLLEEHISAGAKGIYEELEKFLKEWAYPGRVHGTHLSDIVSAPKKHRDAQHIKCQASDMLSLIPVLAMWCQSVLLPLALCTPAVNAFIALCNIVQCLWCAGRSTLQANKLEALVEDFLAKFSGVWGFAWMTPKFHWMLHFGDHLRKLGFLANCFCLERRHRIAKRYANDLKNISRATSDSLLMEVACHHVSSLEDDGSCNFAIGLRNKKVASKKIKQHINIILEVDADTVVYVSPLYCFSQRACLKQLQSS